MDTYADDLAALVEALDLKDAIHVGHSTGGGEVARYVGRHGTERVAKTVLIGAVPPLMLKTAANPGGLPQEAFDGIRSGVLADRPEVASLVGFWLVGFAVLLVCSARVAAGAAIAGQTLSALAVYGVIGLARLVDPRAFASVVQLADYGLSAIIAAWLGAIARVCWDRWPHRRGHVLVVLGSVSCALIGYAFSPNVTFLDSVILGVLISMLAIWTLFVGLGIEQRNAEH